MNESTAPDMEMLRRAIDRELEAMRASAKSEEPQSETQAPPLPEKPEEELHLSFFRRAETLAQLVEEVRALQDSVELLSQALQQQKAAFAAEQEQTLSAIHALQQENRALQEALQQLRETDALIHMRVFDNRVRISELQEALEGGETEAAE